MNVGEEAEKEWFKHQLIQLNENIRWHTHIMKKIHEQLYVIAGCAAIMTVLTIIYKVMTWS